MASQVMIMFDSCVFTAPLVSINFSGATIQIDESNNFSLSGPFKVGRTIVSRSQVTFQTAPEQAANGSVTIPVAASGEPTIVVSNFSGKAAVNWFTNQGPHVFPLTDGEPVVLSGFQN